MKKQQLSMSLVARIIAGITFLGVFVLNVVLFVKVDGNGVSFSTAKAHAVDVSTVECGWWYCPEPDCWDYPRPNPGYCQGAHIFTFTVQKQCDPNGGGDEEEEEEVYTAYEREVITPYTVYSQGCIPPYHRWWTCEDVNCEGTGPVECESMAPENCYWGVCM